MKNDRPGDPVPVSTLTSHPVGRSRLPLMLEQFGLALPAAKAPAMTAVMQGARYRARVQNSGRGLWAAGP